MDFLIFQRDLTTFQKNSFQENLAQCYLYMLPQINIAILQDRFAEDLLFRKHALHKIPSFHLICWCCNFVEMLSSRRYLSEQK